jgi:nucleoside-diphosphate-sugar epimerase
MLLRIDAPLGADMDLTGRTIAITGATGFLGSHIALELLKRGARVRGVVRSPEKGAWLADQGVELARADLMDKAALTEAFRGVDAVVSNAALYVLRPKSWADFLRTNQLGTENVFDAAYAAGVGRIVHVSTCGVYRIRPWGTITEDAPKLTLRDRWTNWAYTVTKSLSEESAWERARTYGQQLTVVRPAGIFGPRDTQAVPLYRWFMRWPLLLVPTLRFPMAHGGDIAGGVIGALENDQSVGRAYNLVGELLSVYQFLRAWKRVAGRGPLLVPLPLPLAFDFDCTAAKTDLGYRNRPIEESIRDTLAASA